MIEFVGGLIVGGAFVNIVALLKRRQMLAQLDAAIEFGQKRLVELPAISPESHVLRERLDALISAQEGRTPIDPRQRRKVAAAIVPSLFLLVLLIFMWGSHARTTSSHLLLGLAIGALAGQIVTRARVLRWRPSGGD